MKSSEKNSTLFPAPAITICSNLFAKDNMANFYETYKRFAMKEDSFLNKDECMVLASNLHWCQPEFGAMVRELCKEYNWEILNLNVLEVINRSALTVSRGEKIFMQV